MRINNLSVINNLGHLPSFGNAYSAEQEKAYLRLMDDIKKDQGYQNGINLAKFYAPALPVDDKYDTGIGKLTSDETKEFYKFIKVYAGANGSKFAPVGQLTDKTVYTEKHYPGAYNRSALSIGEDNINLFDLASEKYGNILSAEDAYKVVNAHKGLLSKLANKIGTIVYRLINFETTLGWQNQENYPVNKVLNKAFNNFKNDENPSPQLIKLREEFERFKNQKKPVDYDDIYTRLALFPYLKGFWSDVDFFIGFDSDPKIRAEKMPQYEAYKEKYKDEIEFYKFKQFLGHKTMQDAKEIANNEGIEFFGDCPIGFSWPERQVFPDAFIPGGEIRSFGLPAINFSDIPNENSAAHKLFKAKITHHLNMFDGLRLDVGWQYMKYAIEYPHQNHRIDRKDMGTQIPELIEKIATEVKGNDFDHRKIMYEADAEYEDFPIQENYIIQRIKHLKNLIVLSTEFENNEGTGWANAAYLKENLGYHDDDIMLGPNTHDLDGIYLCAMNREKVKLQSGALMRVFKLREEDGVKDGWKLLKEEDPNSPNHFRKYMTARLAEITTVKNNFVQLFDLLGKKDKIDYHTGGDKEKHGNESVLKDYQNRLNRDYISEYHQRIQNGEIGTMIGAQKFRMEHDGTKERNPELYARVEKYDAYLRHPGKIYTREQANNSKQGKLNIESLTLDEINNLDVVA